MRRDAPLILPAPAAAALCGVCVVAGCSAPRPVAAPPAVRIDPLTVTTTYIASYAHRYARGQYALVEVCVAADGSIASTRITQSSTDPSFDQAALVWARQARYTPQRANGQPVYACEEVRVEVNPNPAPRVLGGADSALG